jgi:hypothetical protein
MIKVMVAGRGYYADTVINFLKNRGCKVYNAVSFGQVLEPFNTMSDNRRPKHVVFTDFNLFTSPGLCASLLGQKAGITGIIFKGTNAEKVDGHYSRSTINAINYPLMADLLEKVHERVMK